MFKRIALVAAALISVLIGPLTAFSPASADATNLIPNGTLEASANGTAPDSWQQSDYVVNAGDNNQATFTYLNTGHSGGHSVKVQVGKFTSGDDNWYYGDVPVTAGTTYQFSDWYQSSVDTEVDAEVVIGGITQYFKVGTVFANTAWTNYVTTFTAPAGATSMSLYHLIAATGYLVTDDYSLAAYTPTPFNRAIVSVSFDDGWLNQYQNAAPVLSQDGIPATYNIISGEMTNPDEAGYMTSQEVKDLYAQGNEIASHTVHHCDLTGVQTDNPTNCPIPISTTQVQSEMADSQTALQNLTGAPVTDFAYPYGAYNPNTIAVGKQYYASQRTVNAGYNTKDSLDPTLLKIYEVDSNITQAQVQAWITGAIAEKAWLILVYHEVATTPSDPSDATYTTLPTDFAAEMSYLKGTNVTTLTVAQALAEVTPQIGQATDTTPAVISNVTSNPSVSGATITWATDEAATSQINYGPTSAYGASTTIDTSLATTHSTSLTGLTAGTTYHYQVVSKDAAGNTATSADATFTTLVATKPGDANGDGKVNAVDLSILSSHWGTLSGATLAQGDLNGDGKVNAIDLSILSTNWGK